jgi:hypothetical protein
MRGRIDWSWAIIVGLSVLIFMLAMVVAQTECAC